MSTQDIPVDYILEEDYEIDETKQYTLEGLHLGMRVHTGQLSDILYTYILIANPLLVSIDDYTMEYAGTIVYIGDKTQELVDAWNKYTINNKRPCKIYNVEDIESDRFLCPPDTTEDIAEEVLA